MKRNVACLIGDLRRVAEAVPIVERRRSALVPGGELVGAGADGLVRFARRALLVDDDGGVQAEMEQSVEARVLELQHDDAGSLASIDSIEAKNALSLLVESSAA